MTGEQYDDATFAYSMGQYDSAVEKFQAILSQEPENFDARVGLSMAYYRLGDFARAIQEGHKAEKLRPQEQLVHTNLSLFYQKSGDKKTAEHHGLQARIASWKGNMTAPAPAPENNSELQMAKPPAAPVKFPEMPWKKNTKIGGGDAS